MTPRQKELIEDVYKALVDPRSSPYFGMQFDKAAKLLSDKLAEVKAIENEGAADPSNVL